jgi:hypothetical protein
METLLAARPRMRPRLRPSGASLLIGCAVVDFVLASRSEIALLMSSLGGRGFGWSDGAGAVETVLVGELRFISERGSLLDDCSEVEFDAWARKCRF